MKRSPNRILTSIFFALISIPTFSLSEIRLVTLDYPPYITTTQGNIDGVAVRVVNTIFERLEKDTSIEVFPWGRSLSLIEAGEADAIFTAFKTSEREVFSDYSEEILFEQNIVILKHVNSNVAWTPSNLSSKSICLINNVSYGEFLDQLVERGAFSKVERVNTAEQCLQMITRNRADFWASNAFGARYIATNSGLLSEIEFVQPPVQSSNSYIAFSKNRNHTQLVKDFDMELKKLKDSGEYDEIIDQYFNELSK